MPWLFGEKAWCDVLLIMVTKGERKKKNAMKESKKEWAAYKPGFVCTCTLSYPIHPLAINLLFTDFQHIRKYWWGVIDPPVYVSPWFSSGSTSEIATHLLTFCCITKRTQLTLSLVNDNSLCLLVHSSVQHIVWKRHDPHHQCIFLLFHWYLVAHE